jgi:hypothetical protein
MWETFHIKRVIPWVDGTLRTIARRQGRAIYGLSQGGFGSMTYASRHPDLFVGAGGFSGAVETTADGEAQTLTTPIVQATTVGLDGASDPDAMFGPRATQQINWAAHDPATLVRNLRGLDLRFWTGNGTPGPLDAGVPNPGAVAIELGVFRLNELFDAQARAAGIKTVYTSYGGGTHTWPYWARDLRELEPSLRTLFAHPPADPARITYASGDNAWDAWGWSVTFTRPAREFSTLSDGDIHGFALSGSGSAKVVTPGVYEPGSTATVRLTGTDIARTLTVTAGADGRLTVDVPLGPGNPDQQLTPEAGVSGTKVFTTRAAIDGVARKRSCPRRTVVLKFAVRRGAHLSGVRATVDGKRVTVRRGGRRVAVRVGVLTPGSHRVRVVARARVGAKVGTVRVARTLRCAG